MTSGRGICNSHGLACEQRCRYPLCYTYILFYTNTRWNQWNQVRFYSTSFSLTYLNLILCYRFVCLYVYVYVCVCVYIWMYICICVYACICVYVCILVYVKVWVLYYICVYVYMYAYVCYYWLNYRISILYLINNTYV